MWVGRAHDGDHSVAKRIECDFEMTDGATIQCARLGQWMLLVTMADL
jgi:hypothetical protein